MLKLFWEILLNGRISERPLDFQSKRNLQFEKMGLNHFKKKVKPPSLLKSNLAFFKHSTFRKAPILYRQDKNLAYLRIPKTGSLSILHQMIDFHGLEKDTIDNDGIEALAFNQMTNQYSTKQITNLFFVVRNPFSRIVSVYNDVYSTPGSFLYQGYLFGIIKKEFTFSKFVNVISTIPNFLKDLHFKPIFKIVQATKLRDYKWFKIEEPEPLESFLSNYNLKLPHLNKSNSIKDYREYYDLVTFNLVKKIYKKDIEVFNYQKEADSLQNYITDAS